MRTLSTVRSIIINPQGQMLIIKRSATDPLYGGKWDLPGGQVESGESIETALIRETQEEIGLKLTRPQLLFATSDKRQHTSKTWLFFLEEVPAEVQLSLGNEHDNHKWIEPTDLDAYTDYVILLRLYTYLKQTQLLAAAKDTS